MAKPSAAAFKGDAPSSIILEEDFEHSDRSPGDYFFKFQFFVHECILLKDFFNIARPAIALRFLDFPTLILEGTLNQSTGRLRFSQGKKCNFKMNSEDLGRALQTKPFFVMFIDASSHK